MSKQCPKCNRRVTIMADWETKKFICPFCQITLTKVEETKDGDTNTRKD